jgi:import receptor subunit TOM70
MEDVSMVAQLEGYKHEQLLFVDEVLKHLGSALAVVAAKNREPNLPSSHTIIQYFTSFMDDPLFDSIQGDGPYAKAKSCFENKEYEKIDSFCDEEISANGPYALKAKLLKATFLVLTKQLEEALKLLTAVIDEAGDETKVKVNALVKRGALYIQRCHDPQSDATMSYADFNLAAELDPTSADVLMNRGQINLLLDNFQAAVDDLTKASELRPDFALANVQKLYTDFLAAQIANDAKKIDEIIESFKQAVDKYPTCVEVYALYAKVLQEKGDVDGADEMYKKGAELNPDNANLIVHRALLALQKTGDVEVTMAEINRAIKASIYLVMQF